jgi:hypothetical protein
MDRFNAEDFTEWLEDKNERESELEEIELAETDDIDPLLMY